MSTAQPDMDPLQSCRFPDTRWSVIVLAAEKDSPVSRVALENLCRAYWRPLYGFVRRSGWAHADAQDRVQGFLADFLARNSIAEADVERGRFRTFLLVCLKHYLANEAKAARRLKRGGGKEHVSWEEEECDERLRVHNGEPMTPEEHYDREWALALLDRVFDRLRGECETEGKGELFEALREFLAFRRSDLSYEEVGKALGRSAGSVRVTVHRFRKRFRDLLREEVGETLLSLSDLDGEIKALISTLSR